MVKGDIQSSLFQGIKKYATDIDHFLFDILSERLGVYRLSGGTYITNSAELQKSELLESFTPAKTLIRMGSERHFELWMKSVDSLQQTLQDAQIFNKTSLIKVNWTEQTIQKTTAPPFRNWSAEGANFLYERYYAYLESAGFHIIEPPKTISLSDDNHKWGPSPYHFQSEYYEYITNRLLKVKRGAGCSARP